MTPVTAELDEDLARIQWASGLSSTEFSRLLDAPDPAAAAQDLDRLRAKLQHGFDTPADFAAWLRAPNELLTRSPLELIARGDTAQVWRLITFAESGQPG